MALSIDSATPSDEAAFPTQKLGWLLGLLVAAFFMYPVAAYPRESLIFESVLFLIALAAAFTALRWGVCAAWPSSTFWPLMAVLGLGLWAQARGIASPNGGLGREGALGLAWFAIAALAGMGLSLWDRSSDKTLLLQDNHDGQTKPCGTAALGSVAEPQKYLRTASAWQSFRRVFALAGLGFGLYAILQYAYIYPHEYTDLLHLVNGPAHDLTTQSLLHALSERRVAGRLGNPNLFAAQLGLMALFSLSLLQRGEASAWRWVGGAAYGFCALGLLLTGSRGGALTFALASALGAWGSWTNGQRPQLSGYATRALLVLLAVVLLIVAMHAMPAVGEARVGNTSTIRERLYYWNIARKVWMLHPFIGAGPGGFQQLYLQFKPDLARESQYAHSLYFQTAAELGLIGVALLLAVWLGLARIIARCEAQAREHTGANCLGNAWWLAAGALLLAFDGLFEFTMQWREFLILAGVLVGGALSASRPAPATSRLKWALLLILAVPVLAFAVMPTVAWHMAQMDRWQAQEAAESGDAQSAAENYARAAAWLPDDAGLRIDEAAARERLGDSAGAWQLLLEAQTLNPQSAAIPAAEAEWLAARGRKEEAVAQISRAIQLYPAKPDYLMRRAEWNLDLHHDAAARADLETIAQRNLPLWEFQQPPYATLRARANLPPVKVLNQ